jgi:hypothetical protein
MQQMKVRYVQLDARDFESKVTTPTKEQLQEQFEKFSKYEPESSATADNPHGFGYKYPNRATVQYIAVPHEEVRKVVRAGKSEYDWEVEAQKYYQRHQPEFQTGGADAFGLAPTSRPTTPPTTKPFAEVKEQIIEKLTAPEIDRKARDAQDRIRDKLTMNWDAWRAAHPTTDPTTVPRPRPPPRPRRRRMPRPPRQRRRTLRATTISSASRPRCRSRRACSRRSGRSGSSRRRRNSRRSQGIGQATLSSGLPFAIYATRQVAPVLPPAEQHTVGVLQLLQPSPVLHDAGKSSYIFRVTSARPAEKPASMDEVAKRVEEDWRKAQAYELARKQAEAIAEQARNSDVPATQPTALAAAPSTQPGTQPTTEPSDANAAPALAVAARLAGLDSAVTGWFNQQGPPSIPNLPLESGPATIFRFYAQQLLNQAATQPSRPPVAVIELPVQNKVFAAQLVAVQPAWTEGTLALGEAQMEQMIKRDLSQVIRSRWLTFDAVAKRTGWKDEARSSRGG